MGECCKNDEVLIQLEWIEKEKGAIRHPFCDLGGIQTRDLQNRNLTLYSAKLPGLFALQKY